MVASSQRMPPGSPKVQTRQRAYCQIWLGSGCQSRTTVSLLQVQPSALARLASNFSVPCMGKSLSVKWAITSAIHGTVLAVYASIMMCEVCSNHPDRPISRLAFDFLLQLKCGAVRDKANDDADGTHSGDADPRPGEQAGGHADVHADGHANGRADGHADGHAGGHAATDMPTDAPMLAMEPAGRLSTTPVHMPAGSVLGVLTF